MSSVASAVNAVLVAFTFLVIVRVVLSWLPLRPHRSTVRAVIDILHRTTEWLLGFFRRFVPMIAGIDPSPTVAILALAAIRAVAGGVFAGG